MRTSSQSCRAKIYRLKKRHLEEVGEQRKHYNTLILSLQIKQAETVAGKDDVLREKNLRIDTINGELATLRDSVSKLSDQNYKLLKENERLKTVHAELASADEATVALTSADEGIGKKLSWWRTIKHVWFKR